MSPSTGSLDGEKKMDTQEQATPPAVAETVPAHTNAAPAADAPVENPGGPRTVGVISGVVLLIAIAYGLHIRSANEKALTTATDEAAILTVNTVHPTSGSQSDDLALPGSVVWPARTVPRSRWGIMPSCTSTLASPRSPSNSSALRPASVSELGRPHMPLEPHGAAQRRRASPPRGG